MGGGTLSEGDESEEENVEKRVIRSNLNFENQNKVDGIKKKSNGNIHKTDESESCVKKVTFKTALVRGKKKEYVKNSMSDNMSSLIKCN